MKTKKGIGLVLGGMVLGACITLCIGAATETKKDPSHLQIVTYPSGTTGIFDPDRGRIYLYDVNIANCFMIREFTTLGAPTRRVQN